MTKKKRRKKNKKEKHSTRMQSAREGLKKWWSEKQQVKILVSSKMKRKEKRTRTTKNWSSQVFRANLELHNVHGESSGCRRSGRARSGQLVERQQAKAGTQHPVKKEEERTAQGERKGQ